MADEFSTRAADPEALSEEDYQALCAALSANARGRAFLADYARRQRAADTSMLMLAIERLEGLVRSQAPPQAAPAEASATAIRAELHAMLDEIQAAQKQNDVGGLTAQMAQLAATIEQVERRLETIVTPAEPIVEPPGEATADTGASFATTGDAGPSQAQATAIPEVGWFNERSSTADEPADPPPAYAPGVAAALAIGAAIEAAAAAAAEKAEEAAPDEVTILKAGTIPPPTPFAGEDFAEQEPEEVAPVPPPDPLAPITRLSAEERLALFT